jgi:hypothetical protein
MGGIYGALGQQNLMSGLSGSYGPNPWAQQQMDYQRMLMQREEALRHAQEWANSRSLTVEAPRREENKMSARERLQHRVDKWLAGVELPA